MSEYVASSERNTISGIQYVGHIEIAPNTYFSQTQKPNWWHLFWMRVLLGWKWVDKIK